MPPLPTPVSPDRSVILSEADRASASCAAEGGGSVTAAGSFPLQVRRLLYRYDMRLRSIAAQLTLTLAAQISAQTLHLSAGLQVNCAQPCDAEDAFAVADFKAVLAERHIPVATAATAPHILIARFGTQLGRSIYTESLPTPSSTPVTALPAEFAAEGYAIVPDKDGVALTAGTSAGLFYALQTVKQLIVGDGPSATLQIATIRDWPAMQYRGLSDDLSRGPVDTLEFQKKIVRTLAAYKDNLYSPYFENTQQYASNPLPAPPGGSISAADARELVAYAKQFHVLVVPEQEAFGHLRHMLVYDQYQALAETPHGAVLAPGQVGSLTVISQMFTELAQMYPSPFLHVGADETEDLGLGQTKDAVDKNGLGQVYLDFMQQIDTTLHPLGRRLLFWGDIAQDSPDLLKQMPAQFKKDTIAIAWEYNPNAKGFAKYLKPYTDAGFETWVSPGINNWSRMYPNYDYGLHNIQQFTRDGQKIGATGQLNTLWYDDGEALASNNWYGILFGAAAAWQPGESSIEQFQDNYGPVFHGDLTGKLDLAQMEIIAAHDLLKQKAKVGDGSDGLFWIDPWSKDGADYANKIRPYLADLRGHAEKALTLIAEARAAYPAMAGATVYTPTNQLPSNPTSLRETDAIDALELGARRFDFLGLKFELADEIAQTYALAQRNAGAKDKKTRDLASAELSNINGVNGRIQDIKDGYSLIRDLYTQAWLRTNRPYALRPVLEHYDYTIGLWLARMDRIKTAQRQWSNKDTLPAAADIGIPLPPNN
jgi:hexosaminidase